MENETFKKGEKVRLDKEFANTLIVEVVRQTPNKMFTTVKSDDGDEWQTMTSRLEKLK